MLVIFATLLACGLTGLATLISPVPHAEFWVPFAAVVGLCVGSFINVVAYRLPLMLVRQATEACYEHLGTPSGEQAEHITLSKPSSHCPHCKRKIRLRELVPVLSYIALRGKCAGCQNQISARYPLVELFCALLTAGAIALYGPTSAGAAVVFFVWFSVTIALIDADTFLLPDELSMPLLSAGLLFSAAGVGLPPTEAIYGAAVGFGSLWLLNKASVLLRGRDGIGGGDFRYLAACGAFLGWKALAMVVALAGLTGTVVGIAMLFRSRPEENSTSLAIPFGPHLAAAAVAVLLAKPYAYIGGMSVLF